MYQLSPFCYFVLTTIKSRSKVSSWLWSKQGQLIARSDFWVPVPSHAKRSHKAFWYIESFRKKKLQYFWLYFLIILQYAGFSLILSDWKTHLNPWSWFLGLWTSSSLCETFDITQSASVIITENIFHLDMLRWVVKKNGLFTVRLTVRVYPPPHPTPPLQSGCCDFFKISWHILTYFTFL